jgi:O-acetyl-ADP-ribose deacetylase (regulator of RNase III)
MRYTTGNIIEAPAEALVNTVNEVGVMGKGVALAFRDAFPDSARAYQEAAKRGEVHVGAVLVTERHALFGPRWIIHFPTKQHWRRPSRLDWIREGLADLARVIARNRIASIAVPPLGCGNGGLEWQHVRREIEVALGDIEGTDVIVYEPADTYLTAPKGAGVEELTPARALMAEMIRRYSIPGIECTILEAQKLAWFLTEVVTLRGLDDPMRLQFVPHKYGPYSDQLRHLLDALDGSYLHCERRLGDAQPFDSIWFDDSHRDAIAQYLASPLGSEYRGALEETTAVVDGFESPLGMELLATVDWLLSREGCQPTLPSISQGIAQWPTGRAAAARKQRLFDTRLLTLALERLGPRYTGAAPAATG